MKTLFRSVAIAAVALALVVPQVQAQSVEDAVKQFEVYLLQVAAQDGQKVVDAIDVIIEASRNARSNQQAMTRMGMKDIATPWSAFGMVDVGEAFITQGPHSLERIKMRIQEHVFDKLNPPIQHEPAPMSAAMPSVLIGNDNSWKVGGDPVPTPGLAEILNLLANLDTISDDMGKQMIDYTLEMSKLSSNAQAAAMALVQTLGVSKDAKVVKAFRAIVLNPAWMASDFQKVRDRIRDPSKDKRPW